MLKSRRMFDMGYKEVINLENGMRMGYISDAEIDIETGHVIGFVIEGRRRLFGLLGKEPDVSIKWEEIEKIGEDIVLIRREEPLPRRLGEKKFY